MYQDPQYLELVSHVSSCPYLEQGLYHCPYCNKDETFWSVPSYNFKEGTGADMVPNPYDQLAPSGSQQPQITSPVQYPTPFEQTSYPEVLSRDRGASRSPNPMLEPKPKRKYSEYDPGTGSPYEQLGAQASATYPGATATGSQLGAPYEGIMGLPEARNIRPQPGQEGAAQGYQMFGLGIQQVGERQISPAFVSGGSTGLGAVHILQDAQQKMPAAGIRRSPTIGARGRSTSNTRSIVEMQNPTAAARLSPTGMQAGGLPISRAAEGAPGIVAGEAEKGSVTCQHCGKTLRGKIAWLPSNLQRHMREIHMSTPKTECRICGRTFNRGHNLRHHMKAVHGEQP